MSRARYWMGLLLLIVPILLSWIEPLVSDRVPALVPYRIAIGVLADATLLIGLFVLGGEFRDKLRALFKHQAKVELPAEAAAGRAG